MNALKHSLSIGFALALLAGGAACGSADGPGSTGSTQGPPVGAASANEGSQTESCGLLCDAKGWDCGLNKVCYSTITECASHCREGDVIACRPVLECPAP